MHLRNSFLLVSAMTAFELPSVRFYDRLTDAMQAWEKRNGLVGRRGGQAKLIARMRELFEGEAPTQAAVSQWFRGEVVPGPDGGFMLAIALGVRPEWLSLGLGPMVDGDAAAAAPPGLQYAPGNALKLDAEIAARATRPKRRERDAG